MPSEKNLVFIYNADSGILPKMKDYVHKVAEDEAAGCNLYAVTHSPIGMKKEWRRFINDLGIPVRFLSRNEFSSEFGPGSETFPFAFIQAGKDLTPFITTDEINQCAHLDDLIRFVQQRLLQFRGKNV
jgi:hypothetical protein